MPNFLLSDPIKQFQLWFSEAIETHPLKNPEAMTLSTVDVSGFPDARIVLLKGFDVRGFCFFTNRESPKGDQLKTNAKAALTFYWPTLGYQVRVQGVVEETSAEESDRYFSSRVRGSQIGAWASAQSKSLESREEFDRLVNDVTQKFEGQGVPRPSNWGGYRVIPLKIEFWIEGNYRLHDRFEYSRETVEGTTWQVRRLFP